MLSTVVPEFTWRGWKIKNYFSYIHTIILESAWIFLLFKTIKWKIPKTQLVLKQLRVCLLSVNTSFWCFVHLSFYFPCQTEITMHIVKQIFSIPHLMALPFLPPWKLTWLPWCNYCKKEFKYDIIVLTFVKIYFSKVKRCTHSHIHSTHWPIRLILIFDTRLIAR